LRTTLALIRYRSTEIIAPGFGFAMPEY